MNRPNGAFVTAPLTNKACERNGNSVVGGSEIACAKGKVSHQRQRAVASKRTCAGLQKRRDQLPAECQLLLQSGQRSLSVMRQVKGFGYDQMNFCSLGDALRR